jgi:LysR family transcriptional regulator, regulator of abg operon
MSYDLVLIRRFAAVARHGSFSQAADQLGITHSAMTKSIRTLEEAWGVRLFERTTRSVVPTAAGRRLAELAPELLAHAEEGKAQVLAASRRLSIVCGPAIMDSFIPAALEAFAARHPDASVEVENLPPDLAMERLKLRRAHLLLYHAKSVGGFAAQRDLHVRLVAEEPYQLLCTPDHPAAGEQDSGSLLRHDWAIAGYDPGFVANLDPSQRDAQRRAGFPRYRLSSQQACIQLARSGRVITLVPRRAARQVCAHGELIAQDVPGAAPFTLAAVTLADAVDPLAEAFMAALAEA